MESELTLGRVVLNLVDICELPYYTGTWGDCIFRIGKLGNGKWSGNLTKEGLIIFSSEEEEPELVIAVLKKKIRELRIDFAAIFGTVK